MPTNDENIPDVTTPSGGNIKGKKNLTHRTSRSRRGRRKRASGRSTSLEPDTLTECHTNNNALAVKDLPAAEGVRADGSLIELFDEGSSCNEIKPLLVAMLLGDDNEGNRRRVIQHVQSCTDCHNRSIALRAAIEFGLRSPGDTEQSGQ